MQVTGRIPTGKTSEAWFAEGYQSAMADIAGRLVEGGEPAVREWLKNNLIPLCPHGHGPLHRSVDFNVCQTCGDEFAHPI